jgi:hypothetical protein
MTKNNLKEHISWLLSSKSYIPRDADALALPPESALSSSEGTLIGTDTLSQTELPDTTTRRELQVTDVSGSGVNSMPPRAANIDETCVQYQAEVASLGDDFARQDMARLQAGPRSSTGKSKLVSHGKPVQLATPAASEVSNLDIHNIRGHVDETGKQK